MHPKVKAIYDQYPDFEYAEKTHEKNEKRFWALVSVSKKPVTYHIIKLIRVRVAGKEYIHYLETLRSADFLNNPIDTTREIGRYEEPHLRVIIDAKTNLPRATEVIGFEEVYEIPWTRGIVDKWLAQKDYYLDEHCTYIVKTMDTKGGATGARKYSGFTHEQFCNETFDDLVSIGIHGRKTIVEEVRKETASNNNSRRRPPTITPAKALAEIQSQIANEKPKQVLTNSGDA